MEIQVQNCSTKTCQCPGDKVENESGQCVDPELCPSNRRRRRYTDALAAISPKVARYLCLIRRDCAKTACPANETRKGCGSICEPTCTRPDACG
ncbi:hypothetical protein Q1695_007354 [Nippostrongylus brasiliensis]|nr:hypothetical protein Q1695_007354 [Nippostrongylus brasiliensis]